MKLPFLLLFVLASCLNTNDPERQAHYLQCTKAFPTTLVATFPKKLPNNQIGFGFSAYYEEKIPGQLMLAVKYHSTTSFLEMKEKYSKQAIAHFKSDDPCLFVISEEKLTDDKYCDDFLPVSIDATYDTNDKSGKKIKTRNEDVFILSVQKGNHVNKTDTLQIELPHSWEKGHSMGVTMNDNFKTIRYWLVTW